MALKNNQTSQTELSQTTVFAAGDEGYHAFRIPAVITTPAGTVLAFCEGRRNSYSDFGDIDLLLKRSFDGGLTWEPLQIVATAGEHKVGNPTPVIDAHTGVIWLPMLHQTGTESEQRQLGKDGIGLIEIWLTHSTDDGATWAEPIDITSQVRESESSFAIIGPGVSIQLRSGRLLIPSYFKTDFGKETFANAIWSDDHGKTWQHGGYCGEGPSECQAVELSDGTVMMNMRNHRGDKQRLVSLSRDGGATWSTPYLDSQLVEPICQASILRCEAGILFSNPASVERKNMTVRLSEDEGQSWAISKVLWPGPTAYSCLTILQNGTIACLYEHGDTNSCERISFAHFTLDWLIAG